MGGRERGERGREERERGRKRKGEGKREREIASHYDFITLMYTSLIIPFLSITTNKKQTQKDLHKACPTCSTLQMNT